MIYTEEDLKKEIATHKCKLALREIDVPGHIIDQFKPGRLLDYFVHLCIMTEPPTPWRQALKWVNDNRQSILDQERDARPAPPRPSN